MNTQLKKILYISPNGYLGGAERFVLNAVTGHRDSKKFNAAILFFSKGEAYDEANRAGLETYVLTSRFRMRHPLQTLKAILEIRKIFKNYQPDILHSTMPYSHIVASLAAFGLRVKKVWFQHGPVGGRLDQVANLFPVDMIWYNSEYLKHEHHKTKPRARMAMKEVIIKLGIRGKGHLRENLFSKDCITFGAGGRICSWKGYHNIIAAFGEIMNERPDLNFKFILAGAAKTEGDKLYEQGLRDQSVKLNAGERIQFLSHVKEMNEFYKSVDVFIHASTIPEPFGLVVAEAMKNGTFVVGSNTGGVADILEDQKTGFSFSSLDKNAALLLKNVLLKILTSTENQKEELRAMAKRGQENISVNYGFEEMIDQMDSLYNELLIGHP